MTQNLPDRVSLALHHQMNPAGAAQLVKWINKGHRWAQTPVGRRIAFPGQDDPLNLPVRGLPLALSFRSGHSQATHSYPLCSMSRSSGGSSGLHPKSAQQRLHKVSSTLRSVGRRQDPLLRTLQVALGERDKNSPVRLLPDGLGKIIVLCGQKPLLVSGADVYFPRGTPRIKSLIKK